MARSSSWLLAVSVLVLVLSPTLAGLPYVPLSRGHTPNTDGALVILPGGGSMSSPGSLRLPPSHSPVHPSSDNANYYMQEWASISALNGYSSFTGAYVNITIPASSPYSTGFEFNALSSTGDWYQVILGWNWPSGLGCTSGYHDNFQWWNATDTSTYAGENCDWFSNPSPGDTVALWIYVATSGEVCMEVYDWSNTNDVNQQCVDQPDPGSAPAQNYFVLLPTADNVNGYFTGPMTEVIDPAATACRDYSGLPTVAYDWDARSNDDPFNVASYVPSSDEWYPPNGSTCYSERTPTPVSASGDGFLSQYFDGSGGSIYGPHWVAGQETSSGWRFQTDVNPLSLAVELSQSTPDLGQNVTVTSVVSGGVGPWSCEWFEAGTLVAGVSSCTWIAQPMSSGSLNITGLVIDELGDMAQGWAGIQVFPDPQQAPPAPEPNPSADVGQSVSFVARVSGGSGDGAYAWSFGTLEGCAESTSSVIVCEPPNPGTFTVSYQWTDSNGYTAAGDTSLSFMVYEPPSVTTPVASPTSILQGETVDFNVSSTSGSGGLTYTWYGLPHGCSPLDSNVIICKPASAGIYRITVTAVDSDGGVATSPVLIFKVSPAFLGLPAAEGYMALGGAAATITAVAAFVLLRRRRARDPLGPA